MLTSKERIGRIMRREPVDRIGLFEVFWGETVRQWIAEGHLTTPDAASDYFGLEIRRAGGQVTPMTWKMMTLFADPGPNDTVVEETDTDKLVRNGNGALLRWRKNGSGAPEHVDFLVKDRRGWEEHIRPNVVDVGKYRQRLDFANYRKTRTECAAKNLFYTAGAAGAFDAMNELCGHEHVLVGMATDQDWIRDMVDVYSRTAVELLEIIFAEEGLPDGLWVWDDLGFKHRPFMSPGMYRELIFPGHKRLFDYAHSRGLPVILHCDGLVESLIPHLIEAGVDCLQPLEVKAGMDAVKIKKQFGDRLSFIGGMDARVLLSNDIDKVRHELETKVPAMMAGSGYVLQVDHSVPEGVAYETYKFFVETGLKLGTY
jgi:uroporphyrinogen decarboxylase